MRESEYITIASRVRISTAQQILRDICQANVPEIKEEEYRQVMGILLDWRLRLEEAALISEEEDEQSIARRQSLWNGLLEFVFGK